MDNELEKINIENLPKHIAIIMDGNRRWAKREGKESAMGHKEGAENLKRIAKYANEIGIKYMTVYAFSTENWKRSQTEIGAIMKLLKFYLSDFLSNYNDDIKINVIGKQDNINEDLRKEIKKAVESTKNNKGMVLNIAFNYGGRDEIVNAVKIIANQVKKNELDVNDIDEELISKTLYTAEQPDPDLLIRTSGEERISNFLLWQIAYTELVFSNKYWPEFNEKDLIEAIKIYQSRTRKFGGK